MTLLYYLASYCLVSGPQENIIRATTLPLSGPQENIIRATTLSSLSGPQENIIHGIISQLHHLECLDRPDAPFFSNRNLLDPPMRPIH